MPQPSQQRYGLPGLNLWQLATLWFISLSVRAQLPVPVNSSSGAPNGNYVASIEGLTRDAMVFIALAISGAGFMWIGWVLLSKFNEARSSHNPDWGSVGLIVVIAAALLAIVSFSHNKTMGII